MYRIFNAQASAETMYDHYKSDIYLCQVDYGSDASAVKDLGEYGAFHGIFVPMLSSKNNYTEVFKGAFEKPGYVAMAKEYNRYLANFLASGDPNGDGLTSWSKWSKDQKVSMVFDGDETKGIIVQKDVSTTYEDIIKAMKADTSVSQEIKDKMVKNVLNGRWFSTVLDETYQNKSLWADVE
jgi:para-nitrobenzyl esterase